MTTSTSHLVDLAKIATPAREEYRKQVRKKFLFKLFLWAKLPAAFWSGLRLDELDYLRSVASVPYKRLTQNPFKSTYFASLSMAAELSTGVMAMLSTKGVKPSVSMLVVNIESTFIKKATSRTYFTCEEGHKLYEGIAEAQRTGEPVTVKLHTIGRDKAGEEIAKFAFTWSFKIRSKK